MWQLTPLRIAGIYACVGTIWILASDRVLAALVASPGTLTLLQTLKGWLYVVVTSVLVYVLVRASVTQIRGAQVARADSDQRLRIIQSEVAQLERVALVGETASILNHELKTPLSTILLNLRLIERDLQPRGDAQKDNIDRLRMLRGEVQRINSLLEGQLGPLRVGSENLDDLVNVDRVARDAMELLQHQARESGTDLHLSLSGPLRPAVGNAALVLHALLNLMTNALQVMPDGGRLDVEVASGDGIVVLRVRDTGPGIPADQRERIFEPFVTTKPKGTGLGLAIAGRLVRKMGGRIEAISEPDRGACFEIHLPAQTAAPSSGDRPPGTSVRP